MVIDMKDISKTAIPTVKVGIFGQMELNIKASFYLDFEVEKAYFKPNMDWFTKDNLLIKDQKVDVKFIYQTVIFTQVI